MAALEENLFFITDSFRKNEPKFRSFLENAPFGLILFDDKGIIKGYNNLCSKYLGIEGSMLPGLDLTKLSEVSFVESVKEALSGRNGKYEGLFYKSDGCKLIYIRGFFVPVAEDNGMTYGGLGIIEDISDSWQPLEELKKSEEKFRIIAETSSDIIWHLDTNFVITYVSQADKRIRGFSQNEVIGTSLWSYLKPEGIELLRKENENRLSLQSLGIETGPSIYEIELLCQDGSWVWVESTAIAYFNENGDLIGYHGVTRDISERKKAEKLLKERELQLLELNSTKDKLISIIAHDLRSPFNTITGFSELLMDSNQQFEKEETDEFVRLINSTAKQTQALLENLLSWTRAQTGSINFKPKLLSLDPVIEEICEMLRSSADIKNISLAFIKTEELSVYADSNMLRTILRNLIQNAIKFTNSGGKVEIMYIRNKFNIEISVSDNGVGIKGELLEKLFRIDSTISTTGTAYESGSGLGLVLCREFLEKHGGRIWATSKVGGGSKFVFSLPVA